MPDMSVSMQMREDEWFSDFTRFFDAFEKIHSAGIVEISASPRTFYSLFGGQTEFKGIPVLATPLIPFDDQVTFHFMGDSGMEQTENVRMLGFYPPSKNLLEVSLGLIPDVSQRRLALTTYRMFRAARARIEGGQDAPQERDRFLGSLIWRSLLFLSDWDPRSKDVLDLLQSEVESFLTYRKNA